MTEIKKRNRRVSPRTVTAIVLLSATVVWGGVMTLQALAEGQTYQNVATAMVKKVGWKHDRHRPPLFELSDEDFNKRINRIVRHMAIEVDATDAQTAEIVTLVTAMAQDMRGIRTEMRDSRAELKSLLTADQIDRIALEELRADRLADIDRMSKEFTDTLANVAEILTPEQRELLADHMQRFGPMHHRGPDGPRP